MNEGMFNRIILLSSIVLLLVLPSCILPGPLGGQRNVTTISASASIPTSSMPAQVPTEMSTASPVSPTPLAISLTTVTPFLTFTLSPTPTWTPSPTLSRQDALALVKNLLENNGGCRLPCWWGITPGVTEWNQARHFLETFAIEIKGYEQTIIKPVIDIELGKERTATDGVPVQQVDYFITYEITNGVRAEIYVFVENRIVRSAEMGGRGMNFRLHQLLTDYGPPDEVFIQTHRYTSDGGPPPFIFVLYYAQKHFSADFRLNGEFVEDKIVACPQLIDPRIWVDASDMVWTLDSLFDYVFGPPTPGRPRTQGEQVLTLKDATGMDMETFTNIFKNPDNQKCLETPADLWY